MALLLGVALLATSGCTSSLATATASSVAGTPYTSSQYGFSLTIPPGWYLQSEQPALSMLVFRLQGSDPGRWGENVNIISYDAQMAPSLAEVEQQREQFVGQLIESLRATFPDIVLVDSDTTTVAGYPALTVVYTITYEGAKKAMSVTVFNPETTYTCTYTAYASSYGTYLPDFQAMMGSFRRP